MDSNIFKLLNEVMPTTENKNEVYNIIIPLILSKKIFKNSKELKEFVENILEFKIADYAYKSRTILLGKVIKFIAELELSASIELNKNLTTFLEDTIEINSKKKEEKKSSKNHSESL